MKTTIHSFVQKNTSYFVYALLMICSLSLISCGKEATSTTDMEVTDPYAIQEGLAEKDFTDFVILEDNRISNSEISKALEGSWHLKGAYQNRQVSSDGLMYTFSNNILSSTTECRTDLLEFFANKKLNTKSTLNTECSNIDINQMDWEFMNADGSMATDTIEANKDGNFVVIGIVGITSNQLVLKTISATGSIINYSSYVFHNEYIEFER